MDQDVASHDSSHRRKEITQKQEPAVESSELARAE